MAKKLTQARPVPFSWAGVMKKAGSMSPAQIAVGAAGLVLLAAAAYFLLHSPAAITVNGMSISSRRFQALLEEHLASARNDAARRGSPWDPKDPRVAGMINNIQSQLIEQQVRRFLLHQAAQAMTISVSDNDVDRQIALIRAQAGAAGVAAALKKGKMTEEDLRKDVYSTMITDKFLNDMLRRNIVGENEVRDFYAKNSRQFRRQALVRVRHIQTDTRPSAEECLARIRKGGDFGEVARDRSMEQGASLGGGDWGYRSRDQMPPPIAAAAFSQPPGSVSGIIESDGRFHIVKVEDRKPAGTIPLSEAHDDIVDMLLASKQNASVERLVEEMKQKAIIEVNL